MRLYSLLPLLALAAALPAAAQQNKHVEISLGYNAGIPLGDLKSHANTIHGINFRSMYLIPSTAGRMGIGIDLNTGTYASFTKTQIFGFNGVQTPTDVHYNSSATSASVVGRYSFFRTGNLETYAAVKGGLMNFSSHLQIEDPNDPGGCAPVDTKNLISDNTWQGGAQAGANLDMKTFFKKMPAGTFLLQGYIGYTQGGKLDYINVRNRTTDDSHNHTQPEPNDGSSSLSMRFVNLQTNEQHYHEVARVYTSTVRLMEAGVSLVVRF